MKPSQIIAATAKKRGNDIQTEIDFVKKSMEAGSVMLREGNTLLLLIPIAEGVAEFQLYTNDAPLQLYKAMIAFWKKLTSSDIQRLYTDIGNQEFIQLAQQSDWNVQPSDDENYSTMVLVKG
jgi:hypothetical protein